MRFLTFDSEATEVIVQRSHDLYLKYLKENEKLFPRHTYEFAIAEWHYRPSDHRCPHDSWVESLEVVETGEKSDGKNRSIDIVLTLLGAYHDGQLRITYTGVQSYSLNLAPDVVPQPKTHGDWLIDEVTLSKAKYVIHEIRFWREGSWLIECRELRWQWLPVQS